MPESQEHRRMVQCLYDWTVHAYFCGEPPHILMDSRQYSRALRPPMLNGHVPDLYVTKPDGAGAIVGEAKTARDLENNHTYAQLTAFLRWCSSQGQSLLVVAVPWHVSRLANSMVTSIKKRHRLHADAIVLDGLDPTIS